MLVDQYGIRHRRAAAGWARSLSARPEPNALTKNDPLFTEWAIAMSVSRVTDWLDATKDGESRGRARSRQLRGSQRKRQNEAGRGRGCYMCGRITREDHCFSKYFFGRRVKYASHETKIVTETQSRYEIGCVPSLSERQRRLSGRQRNLMYKRAVVLYAIRL